MIHIGFTNIDNAKLVGRLLPFWARGRKMSLLLQSLLSPLASTHAIFKKWALQFYIECHITAQKAPLEWYLSYRLKDRFKNPGATFQINHGINESISCFSGNIWRNGVHWDNDMLWGGEVETEANINTGLTPINTGQWENGFLWSNSQPWEDAPNSRKDEDDYIESVGCTTVYAPAIKAETGYTAEDYERDIRKIMARFMVNYKKTNIVIET